MIQFGVMTGLPNASSYRFGCREKGIGWRIDSFIVRQASSRSPHKLLNIDPLCVPSPPFFFLEQRSLSELRHR